MKIAIIGGKLQGTEAVYLAKKAGFETILIDRDAQVPASGLADRFVCGDAVPVSYTHLDVYKRQASYWLRS